MIGDGIDRVDGRQKVTGSARYAAEWPIDQLTYGVIVQSTIARGTITAIDTAAASAQPGVLDVLTPDNAPRLPDGGRAAAKPPSGRILSLLQSREVRYNGEPIAVVVADTFEQATHAAALVHVTYREDVPAIDMASELPHAQPYTEKILGQFPPFSRRGDPDAAITQAEAMVDQTYTTPIETHNAMEPHATIAEWRDGRLTLHDSTQYVYGVKRFVAKTFGIPDEDVRVISPFVGGAFGSKGSAWSHVVLAAMAAKQVSRPVKVVLTRRQMFGPVGARPYTVQRLVVAGRRDGVITAIKQDVASSTSTFEDWVESSTLQTRVLYAVPNVETGQRLVRLNLGTPTFNRGPGESSGTFGLESALDEFAAKLQIDPVELRLRNYAERDPESGRPFSSKALRECYARAAERFGWSRRTAAPRSMRDGSLLVGFGMATATRPSKQQPASAAARLAGDGSFLIRAATHEFGAGTYTVMTQIAADALGVPESRVHVELGDTEFPESPLSAGSMTAASVGSAVHNAAKALRDRLSSLGAAPADAASCRSAAAANGGQIEVRADSALPGDESYAKHTFGAVFTEVRVDPDLGTVRVARVVGAYAAGRVLNRKTARSQHIGAITYGLAMALHEHTIIDRRTGRYVNADLSEYLVPVNADIPDIDVIIVDEQDDHLNPIGVKGLGELATTGVAAAVANAVFHATGVRIRDLPLTLDKVLALAPNNESL